jgi:hypothetical protein
MLLGGMGPVDPLHTTTGKLVAGSYALFAGVVFLVLAGVMLSPVIHHVLQRFHLEREGKHAEKKMTALIERRAYCLLPGDRPRRAELKID